ncbi:MAG: response regulator [Deltaproteobacteria bacterium]|nr:response regulator [Deltaproteobacteria bacterium]
MFSVLDPIRKRLALKILIVLTISVALVMGAIIGISVKNQREQIRARMTEFGQEMKSLAYAGIKHPMSVGDSASIEKQFFDIRNQLHGTEIVICDFDQRIVFATDTKRINTSVSRFVHSPQALAALGKLLHNDAPGHQVSFEEEQNGKKYLITIHRILNEKECHHCHGATRKVLGSLLTKRSTDATYAAIASLRNTTIAISVLGIGVIIALIYFLLTKLVTRPVSELAAKAEQLARGDLTVSVPVRSEDSIGVLGESFNSMVTSIKEQIEVARSLKKVIADPLFMVDLDMVVTYMNEACALTTGYSREETEGKLTCREILHSDICDKTNCPVQRTFTEGLPVKGIRTTIVSKTGKKIPIMTSASALKDAHGRIVGAVEVFKDISDVIEVERLQYIKQMAKREEEQRQYLELRAENLLEVLAQASEGNLKVRAALSGEECDNDKCVMDKIAAHTNQMLDNLEKLYNKISSFSRELEHEVARRTMMLRDRTLLLEQANRELRELDRLKSSFLANMSHELRTPMNSIIGYTALLLDRVDGEINEEQEKSLQKVANNAKHLLQLINDILDMSKIESGKVELVPEETDIKELIETTASTFKPALEEKNLTIDFDFAPDLPPVFIDDDKTRQILNNLLSNAVKFTERGGITIHARPSSIGIQPGEKPLFVEVCVEDTGIGIKKDDMGKLFDKFSQIDVSTIRQYEGTGLGLSIARGLVVLHKGVIWAESEFGKGTRLIFTLPAQKKVFDKPSEPVLEPIMAKKFAEYFNKPAETFLKEPTYGGKVIRCWEYTHCGQTSCPAYGSKEHRCWLIAGTHCKGIQVAKYPEKVEFCKACEVLEKLVLSKNNKPAGDNGNGDQEVQAANPAGSETARKTILVIDDNPEVIELIRKNIGTAYNVIGLVDSENAVDKALEVRPAAITLDIMMPGKDGWQVLQELKSNPETQDIPVIILSIVDDKNRGFSLGAAEYIVKPINKKVLLNKLKNLEKLTRIKKVLIVDPDPATRELMAGFLREADVELTAAANSREAQDALNRTKPDLIIVNLIMPDSGSGLDLVKHVKAEEKTKNIPFILITEKDLSGEQIMKLNGGIQAILNRGLLEENVLLAELKEIISKM